MIFKFRILAVGLLITFSIQSQVESPAKQFWNKPDSENTGS